MKNEDIKIMWRIVSYGGGNPIQKIEVVSETACFVTIRELFWPGASDYVNNKVKKEGEVFNSFDEAKAALILNAKRDIEAIERNLQTAKNILQRYSSLQDG